MLPVSYKEAVIAGLCGYCKHREASDGKKSCKICRDSIEESTKAMRKRQRNEVLIAYGGKCTCCEELNHMFLEIDHIDGTGGEHRKAINSASLYGWLIRNNFPKENFQLLCHKCNVVKWRYGMCYHQNPYIHICVTQQNGCSLKNQQLRERRIKIRSEVITAYGGRCVCCDESQSMFLAIDHIFNDGNVERIKMDQSCLYGYLKRHSFPKDRYQLLCHNCNIGKARYGICPHNLNVQQGHQIENPHPVHLDDQL